MEIKQLEAKIEAILFSLGHSVECERIAEAVGHDTNTVRKIIHNMMDANTFIPNLYELGFGMFPTSNLYTLTGYEDITKSKDGNHSFTIRVLPHMSTVKDSFKS